MAETFSTLPARAMGSHAHFYFILFTVFGTQNAHLLNLSQELSEYAVIPANQTSSFADDPENNADFESHILFDESTARADSEDYFLSDDYSMLSDGAHAHGSQTDAFVGSDNNFAVQNDAER